MIKKVSGFAVKNGNGRRVNSVDVFPDQVSTYLEKLRDTEMRAAEKAKSKE